MRESKMVLPQHVHQYYDDLPHQREIEHSRKEKQIIPFCYIIIRFLDLFK